MSGDNFQRDQIPEVAHQLTQEQMALMFCVFIRSDSVFSAINELVEIGLFDDPEYYLFVAWRAYATIRKSTRGHPPKELVIAEIQSTSETSSNTVPGIVAQSAKWLIDTAYGNPFGERDDPGLLIWAKEKFQRFYANRKAIRGLHRVLSQTGNYQLIDPRQILDRAKAAIAKAGVLSAAEIYRVTDDLDLTIPQPIPTGVVPWDTATGGGVEARKIYGLFGPTGSFKTGFAIQLMCGMAKSDYVRRTLDPTHRRGQLIYFAYECSPLDIRMRILACAAEIPLERVKLCISGRDRFHTQPNSEQYEQLISGDLRGMSEAQRIALAKDILAGVSIQGMETDGEGSRGTGYVPELVGCVENVVQQTGDSVLAVFIDYAKLMARRYVWGGGARFDQSRTVLSQLPDLLRNEVAARYGTSVVLLQQLDYEANKSQACRPLHHSMSSEAKDLGENMWYCLCLSKIDKNKGHITVLNASKTRDTPGLARPAVLRLDPNVSKLVESEQFEMDESGNLSERGVPRVLEPSALPVNPELLADL